MSITVKCDRCGTERYMNTLFGPPPKDMHTVSPGNSYKNDRILCSICYTEYQQRKSDLLESKITTQLLKWIDRTEITK